MADLQMRETGRVNKSDIARTLGISRPTVYEVFKKVEQKTHVDPTRDDLERQPDPVPIEELDPKYQKMLEWSPEAFEAFVTEFRKPGPRDVEGFPEHHRQIAKVVFGNDASIINVPPRHAKSEIWAMWFPIFLLTRNRDNQIILVSKTFDQAMKHARRIGYILERDMQLINVFGRYKPLSQDLPWRPGRGEFIIEGRSVLTESGDLSLQVRGAKQGILGMAAHYIIADDVVDPEDARSPAKQDELFEWFEAQVLSRMEPDSRVVVLGTRFHPMDLYGHLISIQYEEDDDGEQPHMVSAWEHVVFPAVTDWEKKELLWPGRFNWRYFQKKRAQNKPLFEAMYQQNPASEGSVLAAASWITGDEEHPGCLDTNRRMGEGLRRMVDGEKWGQQGLIPVVRVVSVDPAPVNFTSMLVADVPYLPIGAEDKNFHVSIIESVRDRMGPREMAAQIERFLESYGPIDYLIFEKNSYNRWASQDPSWEKFAHRVRIINHETGKNKSDPVMGLLSLATDFEYGRVRIPYGDAEARDRSQALIDEATQYPHSKTDDILMSLWFIKFQRDRLLPIMSRATKTGEGWKVPRRLAGGYRWNK